MKRSLVSLAVIAAAGQAHAIVATTLFDKRPKAAPSDKRPIHVGDASDYDAYRLPPRSPAQFKANVDLDPISLPLLKGNDEKFGILDGDSITQWPNTGTGVAYAGQLDRHTPAWMTAASRRPMNVAACA